jgi:hypothetical protein
VSAVLRWIESREPPAVMSVEPWVGRALGVSGPEALPAALPAALAADARAALDRALERPGRVRESAFHLLAADALVTYACEAALDTEDPEGCLRSILAAIVTT